MPGKTPNTPTPNPLQRARRVVIKVGSALLVDAASGRLNRAWLETLVAEICEIQETLQPELDTACLLLFASDHGLANDGVSAYPRAVTAQMVLNFLRGGAAANVLSAQTGCRLRIVDVGVDADFTPHPQLTQAKVARGTASILHADAMSAEELERALAAGREAAQEALRAGHRVVLFGEMGIGNTAISSLLLSELTGLPLADCVGPGTGLDSAGVARKLALLERVRQRPTEPFPKGDAAAEAITLLRRYGGFEIAALAAAISTVAASIKIKPPSPDAKASATRLALSVNVKLSVVMSICPPTPEPPACALIRVPLPARLTLFSPVI